MIRRLLVVPIAVALVACASQADRAAPAKTVVIPAGWGGTYDRYHYAPALRVGDTVIVSGIPAMRGDTDAEKYKALFETLKSTLEAAGATLADVVELTSFHTNVHDTASFEAAFSEFAAVHAQYFPDHYPAWSAVGTTALLAEGAPVELRAVAVIGSGARQRIERAEDPPAR